MSTSSAEQMPRSPGGRLGAPLLASPLGSTQGPQPQPPTRERKGAPGSRVDATSRLPLGGAAEHPAPLGAWETQPSTARLGRGLGSLRTRHPKAGERDSRTPRPASRAPLSAPRALRSPPQPAGAAPHRRSRSVLGGCGRVGLGPGAGLGADPEAGLSLRQGPVRLPRSLSVSPPPSSCSGRSPAWGGRRPAGQVR